MKTGVTSDNEWVRKMKPVVAKSWEADFLETPSPYERHTQVLLSEKTHGVRSAAIGTTTIPPGSQTDYHSHERTDEYFIFTKDHGRLKVDGNEVDVEPGIVVCAPAQSKHQVINNSKKLCMHTGFFVRLDQRKLYLK